MNKQQSKGSSLNGILTAALALVLVLALLVIPKSPEPEPESSSQSEEPQQPEEAPSASPPLTELKQRMENQKNVDQSLLAELEEGGHTFEEPYVVLNPYGTSPLSAIILFQTEEPVKISIHIKGKTNLADVDFQFDGFLTSHCIPVYGLYADEANQVVLTAENGAGNQKHTTLEIQTDPLEGVMKDLRTITRLNSPGDYQPGFNFTYDGGTNQMVKSAFDVNGDFRWYLSSVNYQMTPVNYNHGRSILLPLNYYAESSEFYICEYNLLGRLLRVYSVPYECHHDLELTDSNTLIVTGSNTETPFTNEDFLYELDLKSGLVIRTLDYKEILQRTRILAPSRYNNKDWMHMNSVVEHNGDLIVSSNYQSTVMKNSWDGSIQWMLANPKGYNEIYKPYFLTPIGEGFEYPYNQHAVEVLPDYDNNPDTLDIILFDNGSTRFEVDPEMQRRISNNEIAQPPLYSRMVHYRINEKEKTVEQLWQYGKERPELYSPWCGDADLLPNGNRIGCFSVSQVLQSPEYQAIQHVTFTEVKENKDFVWECYMSSVNEQNSNTGYRVERLPLYTETANDLKIGEPVQNFIPEEVFN